MTVRTQLIPPPPCLFLFFSLAHKHTPSCSLSVSSLEITHTVPRFFCCFFFIPILVPDISLISATRSLSLTVTPPVSCPFPSPSRNAQKNHTCTHRLLFPSAASSSSSVSFRSVFSPSLSPDFSHVCTMGARARSAAGAALTPANVRVRLWRSLINTGTGMAKLTSPTSLLALSQGFEALGKGEKEKKKAKTLLHPGV